MSIFAPFRSQPFGVIDRVVEVRGPFNPSESTELSNRMEVRCASVASSEGLCDLLQGVGKIAAGRWGREGFAVLPVELDGLFNNLAQLGKNLFFVWAVAAAIQEARRASYKAVTFLGPFHDFCVKCAFLHFSASWTAFSTARI